jgi:hypothetical protein
VALACSSAIAPAAAQFANRTRHLIALRLLPFLFVPYIINCLDRTSVAYPGGPGEGDEQLYGGDSVVISHRIADHGLDPGTQVVRR